jgi:hypothetical protein
MGLLAGTDSDVEKGMNRMVQRTLLCLTLFGCGQSGQQSAATALSSAQTTQTSGCNVRGVWSLDSVHYDGKLQPPGNWKQLKIISGTHYAWVSQIGSDTAALATVADTLNAYRTRGAGGGKYRTTDSTYHETLEYFSDPRYVGREIEITCEITGDRWDHKFVWPLIQAGKTTEQKVHEFWRRIE